MTEQRQLRSEPFRVKARIVSEIGDELISADDIAIYELIKNAFDAQSNVVRVSVETPISAAELRDLFDGSRPEGSLRAPVVQLVGDEAVARLLMSLDRSTPEGRQAFKARLLEEFRERSTIVISDDGEGMDAQRLHDGFLVLASTERLRERAAGRNVLGSKGVGRFSAKRLGRFLQVETYSTDSPKIEHLTIDWANYASDSELFLDEVLNDTWASPAPAGRKSGTRLTIRNLNAIWERSDLERIARERLSTFMNPFFPRAGFRILVRMNGESVDVTRMQGELLAYHRLKVEGHVDPSAHPQMTLTYTPFKDSGKDPMTVAASDAELAKAGDPAITGPFDFVFYDFIRNDARLGEMSRRLQLHRFLDVWGGGPMLFRDGFRVLPYGPPGFDWLGIDRAISQSGGVRLRTLAMSGYVAITSEGNPGLIDQTNREGLRSTAALRAFEGILRQAVRMTNNQLAAYWPPQNKDVTRTAAAKAVATRAALDDLADEVVDLADAIIRDGFGPEQKQLATHLKDRAAALRSAAHAYAVVAASRTGQIPAQSYPTLIELAGMGMAAEQLTHELLAALDRAESVILRIRRHLQTSDELLLDQLATNFESLRRTASVLLPFAQASRRPKATFDVVEEAVAVSRHYRQVDEERVRLVVDAAAGRVVARLNRGVLLQVFDNLISNSLYWLEAAQTPDPEMVIRTEAGGIVEFEDNGPGIDRHISDTVFQPFVTTKPGGRGLGLFIASELLALQNCRIETLPPADSGRIQGFRLDFSRIQAP